MTVPPLLRNAIFRGTILTPLLPFTRGGTPSVSLHSMYRLARMGQLTVYLRLLDVPLPSIYGPTADERM